MVCKESPPPGKALVGMVGRIHHLDDVGIAGGDLLAVRLLVEVDIPEQLRAGEFLRYGLGPQPGIVLGEGRDFIGVGIEEVHQPEGDDPQQMPAEKGELEEKHSHLCPCIIFRRG